MGKKEEKIKTYKLSVIKAVKDVKYSLGNIVNNNVVITRNGVTL